MSDDEHPELPELIHQVRSTRRASAEAEGRRAEAVRAEADARARQAAEGVQRRAELMRILRDDCVAAVTAARANRFRPELRRGVVGRGIVGWAVQLRVETDTGPLDAYVPRETDYVLATVLTPRAELFDVKALVHDGRLLRKGRKGRLRALKPRHTDISLWSPTSADPRTDAARMREVLANFIVDMEDGVL